MAGTEESFGAKGGGGSGGSGGPGGGGSPHTQRKHGVTCGKMGMTIPIEPTHAP